MPQLRRPACERIGQRFRSSGACRCREEPLDMAVTVGTLSTGQQREGIAGVSSEVVRALETYGGQEQQGQ